jgi:hypothetical protein
MYSGKIAVPPGGGGIRKIIIMLLWKKISKDDLVLTYGVAFLEIEWTSGSLFY